MRAGILSIGTYSAGVGKSGKVKAVYFAVGDSVKQGHVIALLDNESILESIADEQEALAEKQEQVGALGVWSSSDQEKSWPRRYGLEGSPSVRRPGTILISPSFAV